MTPPPPEPPLDEARTELPARDGDSVSLEPKRDEIHYAHRLEMLASRTPHARRYKQVGEIARGGMGAILKIWDEDIRRHLAMKVILDAGMGSGDVMASSRIDLLQRFLDEAQIAGQLDHPGVVPVYELGIDAQGRAYFTMPVVEGRDLGKIIDLVHQQQDGWTRTRALEVFVKVCDTLAYAHAKSVIHRDIKPSNVMVGRYGEVYVMDWGLAKVLGREESIARPPRPEDAPPAVQTDRSDTAALGQLPQLTMDGTVMGTPAYMPPEQAQGRVDELGPRSDVYSVGAMLYHLLAGHPPFLPPQVKLNLHALLARVREKRPQSLAAIDRSIPAELVAICEKAMAREPAQRYASSLELGEDLRAFLESRVVKAHRSGAIAELRKWIARNKGMAVASAVALLAILGGAIASLVFGSIAVFQRNRASDALLEVDQRASQAEALISYMLGELREKLADDEVGLAILDKIGAQALAYFGMIDESKLTESELTRQALALKQIGEVRRQQHRYAEALQCFDAAYRRSRELAARSPGNGDLLYDRGQAEFWIGWVHWQRLELDQAMQWMTSYLRTSEALLEIDRERTDWIREVAYSHHNLAVLALDFGNLQLAAEGFLKEVELLESLLARSPSDELREDLADAFSYRGTTARRLGALEESAEHLARSRGLREALHGEEPDDRRKQYWWALAILLEADLLAVRGKLTEAFRGLELADRTLESLCSHDPENAEWRLQRSVARMELARIGQLNGAFGDALERARSSERELEAHVIAEPKGRSGRRGLARAHRLVAALAAQDGDAAEARRASAAAIDLGRALHEENPRDVVSVADLAAALVLDAELRARTGEASAAQASWREALTKVEAVSASSSFDLLLDPLARALHGLGRREEAAALVVRLEAQGYRPLRPWP